MNTALQTRNLTKRYGTVIALEGCSFDLPTGRIAALVGSNGAGKSTLLQIAAGLLTPSAGRIEVFGWSPREHPRMVLPRIGFLGQDRPLFWGFSVKETMELGRRLNPRWDQRLALERLRRLQIPLDRRIRKLSGGQQAQVALVLALAKRPDLLLLDEPFSSLDPIARREFLRTLIDAVAEHGLTVLLSSNILGDLERVCDFLIVLAGGKPALVGDLDRVLATHQLLVIPREAAEVCRRMHEVVWEARMGRQATLLVRRNGQEFSPYRHVREASLEEIVLAYLEPRTSSVRACAAVWQ
jgi:ABC-2 type transport system ATP-binding protein